MATTNQIKFYKSSVQPSAPSLGSIWFNTVNRTVNVFVGGETQWEKYAGLVDASWNNDGTVLTITNATGATATLNIAQFATVAALNQAISDLNASIKTAKDAADAAQGTANDAVAAAAEADRKAVQEKADREGEITRVEGLISAEATTARAAEQANAKAAKDADDKAAAAQTYAEGVNTALGQEVTRATEKENELAGKISALETAVGAGGSVETQINTKIESLDADVTSAEGTQVRVQVVETDGKITAVNVTESATFATAQALADEIADRVVDEQAIADRIALLDAAETGRVSVLEKQVSALNAATHFEGKVEFDPSAEGATIEGYQAGDIVIYGSKEYIFDGAAWIELGDTTAESGRISALEGLVGSKSVSTQIDEKIAALSDETKSSEDANLVKVTVSQADGNVTGVSVNDEALDAKLKATDDAVALNTAAVADHKTRIEALEATSGELDNTYVKTAVYAEDKAKFEQKHTDLQGEIDAAEGRLDVVEGDIATIKGEQTTQNSAIEAAAALGQQGINDAAAALAEAQAKVKSVSGDADVNASTNDHAVSLSLNKATAVAQGDTKAVTAGAVYDALCWVEFN